MMILALVRNYLPSYEWVVKGGWNIADCVSRSYDLEGMQVGTVAAGRIGSAVLRRLKPFEVGLHYTDRHRLPEAVERELGVTFHPTVESLVEVCDVVTINAPLHPETEHLFDDELIGRMKRGAYLVNTARGKICDRDAVVRALESGQLAGYAGDVWFPQPAPQDHPWRAMPHHGMTPHTSGTSLSAQARYAAGTREILECWFDGRPIREEYLIVDGGKLAGAGAHSYCAGRRDGRLGRGGALRPPLSGSACGALARGEVAPDGVERLGERVGRRELERLAVGLEGDPVTRGDMVGLPADDRLLAVAVVDHHRPREQEAPVRRLAAVIREALDHARRVLAGTGPLEGHGQAAPVGHPARVARHDLLHRQPLAVCARHGPTSLRSSSAPTGSQAVTVALRR